jgi:hypothetical protein
MPTGNKMVYGKSGAYSLVLPQGWIVTNDTPEHDFTATGEGLNFEVIYQPHSSRSALEAILITKNRFQKNGGVDFTEPETIEINGNEWVKINCKFVFRGEKTGSMTCMACKKPSGLFIVMFGGVLSDQGNTQSTLRSILESFEIQ